MPEIKEYYKILLNNVNHYLENLAIYNKKNWNIKHL